MSPETVNTVRAAQIANVIRLAELARKDPVVLLQSDKYTPENRAAARKYKDFSGEEDKFPWEDILQEMDEAVRARSVINS